MSMRSFEEDLQEYEKVYNQFVIENYCGGSSEPITPEYFEETWEWMTDDERVALTERSKR